MEAVKLPLSAIQLLPTYALEDFNKWASLFAEWLDDGDNNLKQLEEASSKQVEYYENKIEALEKDSEQRLREERKRLRYEVMSHWGDSYPVPETTLDRCKRWLREYRKTLKDIQEKRKDAEISGDEVAKYMSWWDWFASLNMEDMKQEIIRLEGNKVGRRVIESMLT